MFTEDPDPLEDDKDGVDINDPEDAIKRIHGWERTLMSMEAWKQMFSGIIAMKYQDGERNLFG